ncbi:hypothetical protein PTW37_10025 [Arthrobacter agilis]|uniref:hypothetical protein n=1 Tax=Arthrobacter agilis TaxID=37921 RepID=UPI0023661140|nr:hypothetical protein [Arthrobacter agilis]WDF34991.1 hypothetical protein PTW37_10025 [Arthrobacter agilis]
MSFWGYSPLPSWGLVVNWRAAVVLLALTASALRWADAFWAWWATINWGSAPEWVGAAGTIGAVFFAVSVARRDGKRLSVEREEAKRDREAFRAEQELLEGRRRRNSATRLLLDSLALSSYGKTQISATIKNTSEDPVYDVNVFLRLNPDDPRRTYIFATLPQLEPDQKTTCTAFEDLKGQVAEVEVQFSDDTGTRWRRGRNGIVRAVQPEDPLYVRSTISTGTPVITYGGV